MNTRYWLTLLPVLALVACEDRGRPILTPLPPVVGDQGDASVRVNGAAAAAATSAPTLVSLAAAPNVRVTPSRQGGGGGGDISLNFADTDIRDVVAQILGTLLGENYTIDPAVRGTATLRTTRPVGREDLLPVLQTLLAQNGATLLQSGGVYRVLPLAAAAAAPGLADGPGGAAPWSSPCGSPRPTSWPRRWRLTCRTADASSPTADAIPW